MAGKPEQPFNSRKYQGQVERELLIGGLLITVIVGGGLIALIWGSAAFFTALACFGLALGMIGGIWLFLKVLEIVSRE